MFGSAIRRPSNSPCIQLSGMAFFSPGSDAKVWVSFLLVRSDHFGVKTILTNFLLAERDQNITFQVSVGSIYSIIFVLLSWFLFVGMHVVLERKKWSLALAHGTVTAADICSHISLVTTLASARLVSTPVV